MLLFRERGLKITKKRIEILNVLKSNNRSYSALEINCHFNYTKNRVTIYRVLADLHRVDIVGKFIDTEGVARYYYDANYSPMVPHFRCLSCGAVDRMPVLPASYLECIKESAVLESVLLLSGTCRACLQKSNASFKKDTGSETLYRR